MPVPTDGDDDDTSHAMNSTDPGHVIDMLKLPYMDCPSDRIVAYRDGQPVNNRSFRARTAAWQQLLTVTPGRRFALFLEDSIDFSSALYGAWLAGKTIYLPGDTLSATCAALSATVDGFLGDFDSAWAPSMPRNDVRGAHSPSLEGRLLADAEGLVVYTSGSSGAAQAIPKRLSQMAAEVAMLERSFGSLLGDADILSTVSHQHIYGLLFKVLWPLAAQRVVHMRSAVFLEELLPWMQNRPCVLISSPAHLTRFPDRAALPSGQAPLQLRAVFSSGGPLAASAATAAGALLGSTPIEIYGSSETGGIAWRRRLGNSAAGSAANAAINAATDDSWTALPGVTWRLDPDEGVLEVRSPHLRDDEWLRLADRATADDDDHSDHNNDDRNDHNTGRRFILQGRTDRIVKLEEKRISLDAIEHCLCASPLVNAAKVLLHSDPAEPQRRAGIVAFVVASDAGRLLLAQSGKLALNRQLKATLSDTVAAIATPRSWRYLDALPLNAQGKTTQADLLALLNPAPTAAPQTAQSLQSQSSHSIKPSRPTMPGIELRRQDTSGVLLELHIGADLLYFDGHFNATAILPGVVQLNWAIVIGRRYFDMPPLFSGVHALKFQQMIMPDSKVMLELQYEPSKAAMHFRLHSAAGQHASGRVMFTHAPTNPLEITAVPHV